MKDLLDVYLRLIEARAKASETRYLFYDDRIRFIEKLIEERERCE